MALILPGWVADRIRRQDEDAAFAKAEAEYQASHTNCPNCGCRDAVAVTTGPTIHLPEHRSDRSVNCFSCGWHGVVDDLVSANRPAERVTQSQGNTIALETNELVKAKVAEVLNMNRSSQ